MGAPAPPPGGATGAPRSAGGSFVGSFFDGGGDDPLEPPAGPGPGRIDVGGNLDGSLNAKTQESSELDAETEWSKHNKGLLDDLGLDLARRDATIDCDLFDRYPLHRSSVLPRLTARIFAC